MSPRARRVLAAACLLSGFRISPAIVSAEPCAARASLSGDAEAIARVRPELERLGVTIDSGADTDARCKHVSAAVELDRSGGIAVAVRDSAQRSEGRVVGDAAIAAEWIDSWLHDDFEVAPAPLAAATTTAPAPAVDAPVSAPAESLLDRVSIAAGYEQAWTETSTSWSGFGGAACVRSGAFCFGARARYLGETVTNQLTAASRHDLAVLATASWQHELGQMTIAPELGLGVGRMTTTRVEGCKAPPACDPTDPNCKLPPAPPPCSSGGTSDQVYVGDSFDAASFTPRVETALRASVPLFSHVWLDATAAVTLAPFGHGDAYATMSTPPPGVSADQVALPGEPFAAFTLGVGVRVGGR